MAPDEAPSEAADEPATDDPVRQALSGLAGSPERSLGVVLLVLAVVLYGVFISQQLLVVVWLLVVGFLVYLFWRFVRAHERIAVAAEGLADGDD